MRELKWYMNFKINLKCVKKMKKKISFMLLCLYHELSFSVDGLQGFYTVYDSEFGLTF